MNKASLISLVSEMSGMSKTDVKKVLEATVTRPEQRSFRR